MTRGHFETTYSPFRSRARDLGIATLTMHHGTVFGDGLFVSELSLYIYIWNSIVFCEFSLFVNIKQLDNIRDNKLNQAFLIYFFYTEKLRQTEVQ